MKKAKLITSFVAIVALGLGLTLTNVGCGSNGPKADISSAVNPQDEISRLETDIKNAQSEDIDVLAFKDYDKSVKYLEEAKSDLAKKQKQEEIIDDLRYSRGYLDSARATAASRRTKAIGVLEARQAAIKAGVTRHPELQAQWTKNDRNLIDKADDLGKTKTETLALIQNRYVDLERQATNLTELGVAKAQVNSAERDGAAKKAPRSLKAAQLDLANAESVISTNVRNPAAYQAAVVKANASARMLNDVMNAIKANGPKTISEATAISMVNQNRQITDLKNDLSEQKTETASAESEARAKEIELQNKDQALRSAEKSIAVQQAIEKARTEFSAQEAEAYQQGSSLVIRLKTVSFPSGRADLPPRALPVLSKVADVAKDLGPSKIRVEGHTDSVGGESVNRELSEKRANAVATYLRTNGFENADIRAEGFGLSKPLASNKSQAGRAQNRRVDIVITPESAAKAPVSEKSGQTSEE